MAASNKGLKNLFCVPKDELLQAKDNLRSEVGQSLLVPVDDVVAKCVNNYENTAAFDTQKGANLGLKCVKMRLAAGLHPGPLGELEHSPRPASRNWGDGILLLRGREGKEWEKGRKGMEGKGEREVEVRERRGRTTCIPQYF